jgi:hypothetical protein
MLARTRWLQEIAIGSATASRAEFPGKEKAEDKTGHERRNVLYETGPPHLAGCCYFFLPDPNVGCQPAAVPFWLGAAAMILTLSFFGFLDSRLLLAMPSSLD